MNAVKTKKNILKLLVSLAVPLLAGFIGSIFTTPKINTWYASLNKPAFNPPNWLFGPVWTMLFLLMGIALFLVWIKESKSKKSSSDYIKFHLLKKYALLVFGIQIILNTLWSFLFFGMENPLLGVIGIFFLVIAIITNIVLFYKIEPKSAYLLIPYIAWVSFATILNIAIAVLN